MLHKFLQASQTWTDFAEVHSNPAYRMVEILTLYWLYKAFKMFVQNTFSSVC